ncbi:MAG: hypothetical protein MUP22_04925 [Desulfobacterales bacterium]|nr:hypothetical protein [Desulfobacterales bacterium]
MTEKKIAGFPAKKQPLPAHAWRFYLIPAWTTVKADFAAGGMRQAIASGAGRIASFNLGYVIEYGINQWLTTGIQWLPGTTLSCGARY